MRAIRAKIARRKITECSTKVDSSLVIAEPEQEDDPQRLSQGSDSPHQVSPYETKTNVRDRVYTFLIQGYFDIATILQKIMKEKKLPSPDFQAI